MINWSDTCMASPVQLRSLLGEQELLCVCVERSICYPEGRCILGSVDPLGRHYRPPTHPHGLVPLCTSRACMSFVALTVLFHFAASVGVWAVLLFQTRRISPSVSTYVMWIPSLPIKRKLFYPIALKLSMFLVLTKVVSVNPKATYSPAGFLSVFKCICHSRNVRIYFDTAYTNFILCFLDVLGFYILGHLEDYPHKLSWHYVQWQ